MTKRTKRTVILIVVTLVLLLLVYLGAKVCGFLMAAVEFKEDTDRAREILAEVAARSAERTNAVRAARDALPPDAPISADWRPQPILNHMGRADYEMVGLLVSDFLCHPDGLSEETLGQVRRKTGMARDAGNISPLEKSLDPATHTPDEILDNLIAFLHSAPELVEFEAAFDLGLCAAFCDETEIGGAYLATLIRFYAARALAEARAGDTAKALDTCLKTCRMATLFPVDQGCFLYDSRFSASALYAPVWYLLDIGELDRTFLQDVMDAFGAVSSIDTLKQAVQVHGALEQTGLVLFQPMGMPDIVAFWLVRGALRTTERAIPYLDMPPYQVADEMDAIRDEVPDGVTGTECAIEQVIRIHMYHARFAWLADIAGVAMDLREYKDAYGAYPDSLVALALTPIPVDPVTGDPVAYERVDAGYKMTDPEVHDVWRSRFAGDDDDMPGLPGASNDTKPLERVVVWRAWR